MKPISPRPLVAIAASTLLVACGTSLAQEPSTSGPANMSGNGQMPAMSHNSIQPETTLSVSASGEVSRAPDMATITAGVQTEAKTASEAMSQNAASMDGVYSALQSAGVAERDMQTSNLSLQPRYDYSNRDGSPPDLVGYTASNQLTVTVRDLDNLGKTMDAIVAEGGNTISGLSFGLDDPSAAQDEARRKAVEKAMERANLYAQATGYQVARIVTINETSYDRPTPMPMMAMREDASGASTKVSGGEVGYSVSVDITFELRK
ncbi:SIMPL domain-containing protein [Henriciella aquimarina]|uniref:SIMPL domain-containing protein n=1 Tax=Henriciella aquimarina TaxID=545261 RepID=UPI001301BCEC|nr:SIMPL domain-containing protein [Henriciella aquimarina]